MKDYYLYLDPDDGILYVQKDGKTIAPVKTSASFDPESLRIRNGFLEVKDFTSDEWKFICDENGHPASLLGPSGYSAVLDLSNDVVSVKVDSENQLDGKHVIETKVRYYLNDTHIGITENDIVIENQYDYQITKKLVPGNENSYILVTVILPDNTIIDEQKVIKIETTGNLHHAVKNLTIIPISDTNSIYTLGCTPSIITKNSDGSFVNNSIDITVLKKESGKITRTILPEGYSLAVSQNGYDFPSSSVIYNEQTDHPGYSFNFINTNNYTDPITVSLYHNDDKVDETVHEFLIIPEIQEVTLEDIENLQNRLEEKRAPRFVQLNYHDITSLGDPAETQTLVDKYDIREGDWTVDKISNKWIYQDQQFEKVQDFSLFQRVQASLNTMSQTIEGAINELFDYVQSSTGVTYTVSYVQSEYGIRCIPLSSNIGRYVAQGDVDVQWDEATGEPSPYDNVCIAVDNIIPNTTLNITSQTRVYELTDSFEIESGQTAYLVFANKDYVEYCKTADDSVETEMAKCDITITVSNFVLKQEISTMGLRSEPTFVNVPLEPKVFIPAGSIQSKKSILIKPALGSDYTQIENVSDELITQLHKEILQHSDRKLTLGGSYLEVSYIDNLMSPSLNSLNDIYTQSQQLQSYLGEAPTIHISVSDVQYVTTEGEWVDA